MASLPCQYVLGLTSVALWFLSIVGAIPGPGTEINPSVMVLGIWDYELWPQGNGSYSNRCADMVKKVAEFGGTRVHFVPTHYWFDGQNRNAVDFFCARDGTLTCHPFDDQLIEQFRVGMQMCFQEAVNYDLDIAIAPHLDDASPSPSWRNGLLFDPLEKYGDYSYFDVMLQPMIQALQSLKFKPRAKIYFAMQGEMSATVIRYPESYRRIVPMVRKGILAGRTVNQSAPLVKVGVSVNYNKLDAVNNPMLGIYGRVGSFDIPPLSVSVPRINPALLDSLFRDIDFIGISAYAELPYPLSLNDLEIHVWSFVKDLAAISPDLVKYVGKDSGKEFHYSEYGIGGGTQLRGTAKARTPADALKQPFFGIVGNYNSEMDPWQAPVMQQFQRDFYKNTSIFLMRGGGPTYPVHACFLWGMGSWDVLGIYPESTTLGEGSYRDEVVVTIVKDHNQRISGRAPLPGPTAALPGPTVALPGQKLAATTTTPGLPEHTLSGLATMVTKVVQAMEKSVGLSG